MMPSNQPAHPFDVFNISLQARKLGVIAQTMFVLCLDVRLFDGWNDNWAAATTAGKAAMALTIAAIVSGTSALMSINIFHAYHITATLTFIFTACVLGIFTAEVGASTNWEYIFGWLSVLFWFLSIMILHVDEYMRKKRAAGVIEKVENHVNFEEEVDRVEQSSHHSQQGGRFTNKTGYNMFDDLGDPMRNTHLELGDHSLHRVINLDVIKCKIVVLGG